MTNDQIVNGLRGLGTHVATLQGAIREMEQQARVAAIDARNNVTYIIWKEERNSQIDGHAEVVGLYTGTYEEADALLERLNGADPDVQQGFGGRVRYGYYRTEPTVITAQVEKELMENFV